MGAAHIGRAIWDRQRQLLVEPLLTVWFDVPVAVAAQRLASARVPDKFEAQPQQFFEAVAGGYARRMAQNPDAF